MRADKRVTICAAGPLPTGWTIPAGICAANRMLLLPTMIQRLLVAGFHPSQTCKASHGRLQAEHRSKPGFRAQKWLEALLHICRPLPLQRITRLCRVQLVDVRARATFQHPATLHSTFKSLPGIFLLTDILTWRYSLSFIWTSFASVQPEWPTNLKKSIKSS